MLNQMDAEELRKSYLEAWERLDHLVAVNDELRSALSAELEQEPGKPDDSATDARPTA